MRAYNIMSVCEGEVKSFCAYKTKYFTHWVIAKNKVEAIRQINNYKPPYLCGNSKIKRFIYFREVQHNVLPVFWHANYPSQTWIEQYDNCTQ